MSAAETNTLLRALPAQATVYLLGAGGCGMSGLGHLLLDLGFHLAGSDLLENEEIRQLRARGATIHIGHSAGQIHAASPALVVHSSAVRPDNPEWQAADERHLPLLRRGLVLAALAQRQQSLCVAGTHGKTTTTAWLAFALEQLGACPSYAVGALVPQLFPHACFRNPADGAPGGSPRYFALEADESDGTLRDFIPEHAIVLNVDAEHLDHFADIKAVGREFQQFAGRTRGHLVYCADDSRLRELLGTHAEAVSFGFHPQATYRIVLPEEPAPGAASGFTVWHSGRPLGAFAIGLLGEQNVSNAGAVIALLHRLGFAPEAIARAIAPFRGAARRQQEVFADERCRVFDDYGHHPTEIRATLRALKSLRPRRLLVAFQPHRYTRTRHLLQDFALSFREADRLWLTEIYAASEPELPGVSSARLAEAIRAAGQAVEVVPTLSDLPGVVRGALQAGDLVLFIGAGDITQAARQFAALLRRERSTVSDRLFAQLTARLSSATILRRHEPLGKRTTMRVGGKADLYVEPGSEADLGEILRFCAAHALPFTLLGRGSNLLIKDGGIRGVVICLAHPCFSRVEVVADRLHCGAGAKLKTVASEARRHGLGGMEFLEGIPGSVGGGLRMNAGAMGAWMFDLVERIRFMDDAGQVHEREAREVQAEYRGCPLFRNHIALGVVLKGQRAAPEAIQELMSCFNQKRWQSQPSEPSAGCIFKNPQRIPAGKLLDELGLKGTRAGGARVSEVHANFIVNDGNATARDVLNLIEIVKQRARSARGIELETEVEIVGEDV